MKNMLIAGNWKMNKNVAESENLVSEIVSGIKELELGEVKILVCPSSVNIYPVAKNAEGSPVMWGAQNCHFEATGAFTGETSLEMLKSLKCSYVILGHSERRAIFGETDELIAKKVNAVLNTEITPILCIGETLEERNAGKTFDVLFSQLDAVYNDLNLESALRIVLAYEPVWAIGTGVSATNDQVNEAHDKLREYYINKYGEKAEQIYILYGGSLNDKNCDEILSNNNVNGGLIGGAALKSESFIKIITAGIESAK